LTDGENATVLGPSHGLVVKGATLTGISVELCPNSNRPILARLPVWVIRVGYATSACPLSPQ